ncbi:hypothetical protein QQS21_000685 [Conoideocrella luteorostrata]|uniref:Protein yippee-like n=1 Tax=Conoideocrella luteorostrata TaxID=1105319 RepID=A0AAJ0CYR5_9HYPO|nr:hypothetical protein QQS21_000685 [Conoideocrella luteorostrata]
MSLASSSNKVFSCNGCQNLVAEEKDVIHGRDFRGWHGKAFLIDTVFNVGYGEPQEREMTTGHHVVRDISCKRCHETVGWTYDKTPEGKEKYKEGKFILEAELFSLIEPPRGHAASSRSKL